MTFDPIRMRNLRIKKGLTLRGVAAKLGIKHASIQRYEKGEIVPKIQRVEQIAEVLGTTADYLMGRTDDPIRLTMDDLAPDERKLLRTYRRMNPQERSDFLRKLFGKDNGS